MSMGFSAPSWIEVIASLLLVAVSAAVAYLQRLGLTRELLVAAVRAGVQLVAVGAVLGLIFARGGPASGFGWVIVMVVIAGQVAGRRGRGLRRARWSATAGVTAGTIITLGTLLLLRVIAIQPRVVVLLGGMIVFEAMLAAGLTLRWLREDAEQARPAIEVRLCLGLSAGDAFLPHQRSALRTALVPAIDSTKVVGLISLPGAMTGLILAGVDPLTAIRYQNVVTYMLLAAAAALAALATARLAEHALFDNAHRLVPLRETPGEAR
jgi:putative ABC transport system permease protein